jgi:hypothetical protein
MKLAFGILCTVLAMAGGTVFVLDWWAGNAISWPILLFAIWGLAAWATVWR